MKCGCCENVMHSHSVNTFLSKNDKCRKGIWKYNKNGSSMETSTEDIDYSVIYKSKANKSQSRIRNNAVFTILATRNFILVST